MPVQRAWAPLTSVSVLLSRFASSQANTPLLCHHVPQRLSSRPRQMSSKRKMQTSTAYHPSSLDLPPPPPRNTGIPDTSIAGGIPQSTSRSTLYTPEKKQYTDPIPNISLPESEAQKSRPVTNSQTSTAPAQSITPTATTRKPRPRLKALKSAITLTPSAVAQMRTLLASPTPKLIKVGTKNKGCSGLGYHLEYVDKVNKWDETVEQDGVKVVIDQNALMNIIGSEMDWVEDNLEQRFVFKNPNITEMCGCGESFKTK